MKARLVTLENVGRLDDRDEGGEREQGEEERKEEGRENGWNGREEHVEVNGSSVDAIWLPRFGAQAYCLD